MQRYTRQRQGVIRELERVNEFRSAQQIFEDLHNRNQPVGLATVYRNLQTLAEKGDLDVLQTPDGETLYRHCQETQHHHHLICRTCGHTIEISTNSVESWIEDVSTHYGFTEVDHSLELFGLCNSCSLGIPEDTEPAPMAVKVAHSE